MLKQIQLYAKPGTYDSKVNPIDPVVINLVMTHNDIDELLLSLSQLTNCSPLTNQSCFYRNNRVALSELWPLNSGDVIAINGDLTGTWFFDAPIWYETSIQCVESYFSKPFALRPFYKPDALSRVHASGQWLADVSYGGLLAHD